MKKELTIEEADSIWKNNWKQKVIEKIDEISKFDKYTRDWFLALDTAYREMFDWIWKFEKENSWGQGIGRIFHDGVTVIREITWGMKRKEILFDEWIGPKMYKKEMIFILEDILRIMNRFKNNEEFDYGWNLYLGCNSFGDYPNRYELTKYENVCGTVHLCATQGLLDAWKAKTEKRLAEAKSKNYEISLQWATEDLETINDWKNNHPIFEDSIYDEFRNFTI